MVFWKFTFREIRTRPGRAILTLLSIVIGVAAVVSITIATATTRRAYREMFASVSGRANLEVVAEGGGSYDEKLLSVVEQVPGVKAAVPIVQRPVALYFRGRKIRAMALGIDPARDAAVRDYEVSEGQMLDQQNGVLLEESFAENIGAKVGDEIRLFTGGLHAMKVAGLLRWRGPSVVRLAGLAFLSLPRAQALFGAKGQLDTIQVVLDGSADEKKVAAEIARQLPVGLTVRPPVTHTQQLEETLLSSEQGLLLATAFCLLLATFIILNTFLMNVGERRPKLAMMRAIGATRRQISRLLLGESLVLGIIGTALGILVGFGGAYLLSRAIDKLLMVSLPPMQITPLAIVLAAVFGPGLAVLGAAIPARRAGRVSPLEGMSLISHEDLEGSSHRFTIVGTVILAVAGSVLALCIFGWLHMDVAVWAAVFILLGAVLLMRTTLGALSHAVVWLLSPLLRAEARLAQKQILRHRTRSALTVGVLFVASSTGIGLANAILDNVQNVRTWQRRAIVGDFFIRVMMPDMATGTSAALPEALGDELRKVPGVTNLDTIRIVQVRAANQSAMLVVREFTNSKQVYFDLYSGDPARVRQQILDGEVVVGTVLAQRTGLKLGDEIPIETREGLKNFRIAGLANDYLVGGLAIFMDRKLAERLLGVQGVDGYIVQADPQELADVKARLQAVCDKYEVLLFSDADISRMIAGMVRGVDGCLWGILALGFVVAAFGVVNTLTMNVLEQTRELGLLRIVAMTRWQVRKTIFTQAAIIGSIGLAPGVVVGVGVAYLINLSTMPALGHPVEFIFHPLLLVGCFVGAFTMVVLAAWFPAERAARLDLTTALQYE